MIGPGGGPEVGGGGPAVAPAAPAAAVKGLEARIPQARTEAAKRDASTKEAATPREDSKSKIPVKVRENDDFKRVWGDYYNAAKTNSPDGKVDPAKIDKLASDSYYSDLAEKQQTQGIPKEISDDPKFQKEYGKVVMDAQKEGKPLDRAELEKRALADYLKQKDITDEATVSAEGSDAEKRITNLEQQIESLTAQNQELNTKLAQITITTAEILQALAPLLKDLQTREQDPKKKETLAELIAKILALAALSMFTEAAKAVIPPSR